jgi:hypothetical protein
MRLRLIGYCALIFACACDSSPKENSIEADSTATVVDSLIVKPEKIDSTIIEANYQVNDTLNTIAQIIGGSLNNETKVYDYLIKNKDYLNFSNSFNTRWKKYDTTRIQKLKAFQSNVLSRNVQPTKTLFYPFSGPDILYAHTFFPDVEHYIMIGLEPVGTLPKFTNNPEDSIANYFNKINSSLNAILKFSFFRTESMSKDLKNEEVDGTLHLLLLFLNRTGNSIVSAKPVSVDSAGILFEKSNFMELKKANLRTKGVSIEFVTPQNQLKKVTYFSLNAANDGLSKNKGFVAYLNQQSNFNTYLKGASYLLHGANFSIIRNIILNGAKTVIQDDSGIAFRYFDKSKWDFKFFGDYVKPISLFSKNYQKDLDSVWHQQGSEKIGFGIGYNFKDNNSNLLIATKKNK